MEEILIKVTSIAYLLLAILSLGIIFLPKQAFGKSDDLASTIVRKGSRRKDIASGLLAMFLYMWFAYLVASGQPVHWVIYTIVVGFMTLGLVIQSISLVQVLKSKVGVVGYVMTYVIFLATTPAIYLLW